MSDVTYLTREGYEKLMAKLQELRTKGRAEMADAIQKAREMGDLSENAEYDAAKDAQGLLEMEISKLETTMSHARILDSTDTDIDKAYILTKVRLKNLKVGKEITYTLVAEEEADLKANKLSVKSPVGKAVLGKSVGDIVMVEVPAGNMEFELLEISR